MNRIHRSFYVTTLAAALALGTASAAGAADATAVPAPPAMKVFVADLDLAAAADVRTLYRRIERAANSVCRQVAHEATSARGVVGAAWRNTCYDASLERAVAAVGNARLTELHRGAGERIAGLR
jgi:UrcA family protein